MNSAYHMVVDLTNKPCLVVGGGNVAERKISGLLAASAKVKVVSPELTPTIQAWIDENRLEGMQKQYETSDGEQAFLIIAATDQPDLNQRVHEDALKRNQLINVVDAPELSSFLNPAVFNRGLLQIAVTTRGASPMLAKRICKQLQGQYGKEYEIWLDFLKTYRLVVKAKIADEKQRRQLYDSMLDTDGLDLIRSGQFERFREQALGAIGGADEDF